MASEAVQSVQTAAGECIVPANTLRTVTNLVRVIHPYPVAVVMLITFFLLAIAHGSLPEGTFLVRAMGVVFFSQVAVGALNDYVDRFDDALRQPSKPIPSGLVEASSAKRLAIAAAATLVPLSATFGLAAFALSMIGTAAGLAYDIGLKRTPLSFLGYLLGFLSLVTWAWLIAGTVTPWFLCVYPLGSLLIVAAHLAQAFPDIETDAELGQAGLGVVLGPTRTYQLMMLFYGVVAAVALVTCLVTGTRWGALLVLFSVAPAGTAWLLRHRVRTSRRARVTVFRLVAPGIGLVALGSVLALASLTGQPR